MVSMSVKFIESRPKPAKSASSRAGKPKARVTARGSPEAWRVKDQCTLPAVWSASEGLVQWSGRVLQLPQAGLATRRLPPLTLRRANALATRRRETML